MAAERPPADKDAFVRKGREIYERVVRPRLTPDDDGKYLLIDVDSEDFELASESLQAYDALRERRPDLRGYSLRVNRPIVRRWGHRRRQPPEAS